MPRALLAAALAGAALVSLARPVDAAPKPKYHFELTKVMVRDEVTPDIGAVAQPRVEAQVKTAFGNNPQLVADLPDAPDPYSKADAYRVYLTRKGLAGSFLVTVEITSASEVLEPMPDRPSSQRLTIHVALHVLGETIPGRTMGFTGDGEATIKQEVGKTLRDKDRQYSWDQASELAVADAIKTSLAKLAKPHDALR